MTSTDKITASYSWRYNQGTQLSSPLQPTIQPSQKCQTQSSNPSIPATQILTPTLTLRFPTTPLMSKIHPHGHLATDVPL